MIQKISEIRKYVRNQSPLIHCITNPISINQCANLILGIGARPIMAEHPKEVCEITETADALMLNIGNITDARIESIMLSAKKANETNIPVVLDVVGISCSELRRSFVFQLLDKTNPTVIKGNYSEIKALYQESYRHSGVDAEQNSDIGIIDETAVKLSQKYQAIILVSGKTDIITDGKKLIHIKNGTPQLSNITGTGCMLGALCAAYLTANENIDAVITASVVLGICGQLAETDKGNGSFTVNLFDALSTLSCEDIENNIKMEVFKIEQN